MANKEQKKLAPATVYESVIGCKWSRQILFSVAGGIRRPGAITRRIEGLSTKVQTDCLKKMINFGILEREDYAEVPPRVEYRLTEIGQKMIEILKTVETLQLEIEARRNR
jgi:DNA-binding HxlR family transcriptional regulator